MVELINGGDPDILGRVMALEQRARGLSGRVNALEIRFSSGNGGVDPVEFVPAEQPPAAGGLEGRVAALEASMGRKPQQKVSMLDATGLVVGLILLAAGILLATGSIDLLRNPLLSFSGGVATLSCALYRLWWK